MSPEQAISWNELWAAARQAASRAYAPYSNLKVGAAGLTGDGRVVTGCNVENASYGLGLCAECALVGDLHRTGGGLLVAVAVTDGDGHPLTPCGRCRQILYEAGGERCRINETKTVGDLLPGAFGPEHLP
ncbi:cytidine deaminase [Candidatus Poriferisocius sp.]|uniref:cytidine deaminase n=1 Tax=Candidatus Poriferisocius sp. TaxID=3101276 RepID=UPI003B01F94E